MKKLILLIFSSLTFTNAHAQKQIPIDDAPKYLGHKVVICDSVFSVKVLPHLTFVNIGGDYPKQKLTLIFYKKDLYLLDINPLQLYKEKRLCITGKLIEYEGKAQIIIRSVKQIKIN